MADSSQAFYIVTVAGGKCLENTQSANGVLDCLPKEEKSQHWIIETGEDENTIAIKSAADGRYLRNNEPHKINWATIGMGEKQWWTLEKGKTPGSCLIRSPLCTAAASYLNDFQGKYQDRNYVHMWQMNKQLIFWLEWYFRDAKDTSFSPVSANLTSGTGKGEEPAKDESAKDEPVKEEPAKEEPVKDDTSTEKLQEAEKKLKDLEQREAALKKRESDLAAKEKELENLAQKKDAGSKGAPPAAEAPAQKQQCNHKVYPPPRKIQKKVVGFLYEGPNQASLPTRAKAR